MVYKHINGSEGIATLPSSSRNLSAKFEIECMEDMVSNLEFAPWAIKKVEE